MFEFEKWHICRRFSINRLNFIRMHIRLAA